MLHLELTHRQQHLAGQHYVVRLTAPDGYTATRSYSVASAPSTELIELCVERLDDGEVSGYLYEGVEVGDELEVRGPIGGWFVWDASCPALGVGGGTGVVPLVAMLRHATDVGLSGNFTTAVSGRTAADIPYLDELCEAGALISLTRATAEEATVLQPRAQRSGGRVTTVRLEAAQLAIKAAGADQAFVCGSAAFAEAISSTLVDVGLAAERIRVERFGPSG